MKYVWAFIGVIALIDVIACVVFISGPSDGWLRGLFVSEDSLVENLTAGLYFLTILLALVWLNIRSMRNTPNRKVLILLAVLGLVGFLEEVSYGERLFGIDMPVVGGMKVDALHDFLTIGVDLVLGLAGIYQLLILLALLGVIALSLPAIVKYVREHWDADVVHRYYPAYLIASLFIVLIFFAFVLDTNRFEFPGFRALEECFELNAALALLTASFLIYKIATDSR